jgi:branched-chain amino acid transport system substrate-binding protein
MGTRRRRLRSRWLVAIAAAGAVATGCSGDDATPPTTTAALPTTTLPAPRSDGVLRLGVLLPRTGAGSSIGAPLLDVIRAAVDEINAVGGVLGRNIQLVARDEGPDLAAAGAAAAALVEQDDVDAVIGPASSRVALNVLPRIVEAGVLACSPVATAASLADLPDEGLFVRTVASDGLQAQAIVRVIEETGVRTTALAYPDDPYGRRYAQALRMALAGRSIGVADELAYDPADESFAEEMAVLLASAPPVVALIGDLDSGSRALAALLDIPNGPIVVANDPLSRLAVTDLDARVRDELDRFTGVAVDAHDGAPVLAERLGAPDPAAVPAFAAAALDCVDLIALAALQAGTDDAGSIADLLTAISRGGSSCEDFVSCRALVRQDLNIDYDGPTGLTALDANGDQSASSFVRYGIEDGVTTLLDRFTVSLTP